jgi:hypothetical protein
MGLGCKLMRAFAVFVLMHGRGTLNLMLCINTYRASTTTDNEADAATCACIRSQHCAAAAAAAAGSSVSIAALGGSITAGYIGDSPDGSWVDSLVAWLKVRCSYL